MPPAWELKSKIGNAPLSVCPRKYNGERESNLDTYYAAIKTNFDKSGVFASIAEISNHPFSHVSVICASLEIEA